MTQKDLRDRLKEYPKSIRFWDSGHIKLMSQLQDISSYNVYGFHSAMVPNRFELRVKYNYSWERFEGFIIDFSDEAYEKFPSWHDRILFRVKMKSILRLRLMIERYIRGEFRMSKIEKFGRSGVAHFRKGSDFYFFEIKEAEGNK